MRPATLTLLLLLPVFATAQTGPAEPAPAIPQSNAKVYETTAVRLAGGAIQLDGRLDEAAWLSAPVATGFVQMRPVAGAPASERTEARVAYDDGAIYVGMTMHDSQPDAIDARLGRRDSGVDSDWAIVGIDSHNDDRTAYVFQVNAAGVQNDALLFNDVDDDGSWDAVWDAQVARTATGWSAEFRIPFSQLRFDSRADQPLWGLEFGRRHFRTNEESFWAPLSPEVEGVVSRFGTLNGLQDLSAPRQLEIVPYVSSSLVRAPGNTADPYFSRNDVAPRVGLDAKYGLTSELTLTASINPDFGQVEADPAQVNLRGFELFLEERRPFFVEGSDVFSFGRTRAFINVNRPNMLYTRRIGRSPQRGSFVPQVARDAAGNDGTVYSSAPNQSTILGAAKLSGRVGGLTVGVLHAVTAPEYGRFTAFNQAGAEVLNDRTIVEPLSNYTVARVRGNAGRTYLGGAATAVHRSISDDALSDLLPVRGYLLEADVEHTFANDWILSGVLAGSHVGGSAASITRVQTAYPRVFQRPDAQHLSVDTTATSLQGTTGVLSLTKSSGRHWQWSTTTAFTSPGFDSNSLGFQSRADDVHVNGILAYNQNDPQGILQDWGASTFAFANWNFDGDRTNGVLGIQGNARLRSFAGGRASLNLAPRATNDRLTRGGPLATDGAGFESNIRAWSDDRKPVSVYGGLSLFRNEIGSGATGLDIGVEVRPSPALSVQVGPEVELSRSPRQYVGAYDAPTMIESFGRRYVFGEIEQTSLSFDARVNWTFSPNLSLELYARPFVTRGQYVGYSQLGAPGQLTFPVFGEDVGTISTSADGTTTIDPQDGSDPINVSPNFTVRALQGNAVLRWQYRPGSALFLVWQQGREGFERDGDLRFRRDVGGLFSDPVENVFLVKLSYWLG